MRYVNLIKNIDNWWTYLGLKFGLKPVDPVVWTTRTGITVMTPLRMMQTFKEIFMDECYLAGMGRPVPKDAVVIDIGANVGYFSLFAAHRFDNPRIIAVEPIPANFALLEKHRDINPSVRLTCLQAAVGSGRGTMTLSFNESDSFTTSATVFTEYHPEDTMIEVPCLSIPDLLTDYGLLRCDLLKMDCEGAEYDILYTCPREVFAHIAQMALEVHQGPHEGENIDALDAYLQSQGYETRRKPVGMLWAWQR